MGVLDIFFCSASGKSTRRGLYWHEASLMLCGIASQDLATSTLLAQRHRRYDTFCFILSTCKSKPSKINTYGQAEGCIESKHFPLFERASKNSQPRPPKPSTVFVFIGHVSRFRRRTKTRRRKKRTTSTAMTSGRMARKPRTKTPSCSSTSPASWST